MRGLEQRFPKIRVALLRDPKAALARAKKSDVPLLYWSAASWGATISLGIGRADLAGDLHVVRGLAERALSLDPDYASGATHELMISLESLDELVGGSETRAREHFKRAIELQKGQPQAGPYVSLATGIALKKQNRDEFEQLLKEALAIDPDKHPKVRLANLAAQRRAQFLLDQIDELFPR
jgi:tetratricopeptide (TPR) repeat protein